MGIWVAPTAEVLGMGASVSIRLQSFVWTCTLILLGRRSCDVKKKLSLPTEKLLVTWKRAGLELKPHPSAECSFCRRPLHFEVMSEREKSYFSGMMASAQA